MRAIILKGIRKISFLSTVPTAEFQNESYWGFIFQREIQN